MVGTVRSREGGGGSNTIEIVFTGKDLTKNTFASVGKQVQGFSSEIASSTTRVAALDKSLRSVSQSAYSTSLSFVKMGQTVFEVMEEFYRFGQVSGVFENLSSASEAAISDTAKLAEIFKTLGAIVNDFLQKPLISLKQFDFFLNSIDKKIQNLQKAQRETVEGFQQFSTLGAAIIEPGAGLGDQIELFKILTTTINGAVGAVSAVGQQIFYVQAAFSSFSGLVNNSFFNILIRQNIQFREQLISTQASLASVAQVVSKETGEIYSDPFLAINKLQGSVLSAIKQVRRDSLELAGLTSNELIELFQIIASEAGNIGVSLSEVGKLTVKTAGALSTLGVPLYQARQEVLSILQGQITSDSVLAKTLGITSQMVGLWKQQGTLVDNLLKRFDALNQGQSLVAKSIRGVTSNIAEVFEELGRTAGEPLLDPIVAEITKIYDGLTEKISKKNPLTGVTETILVVNQQLVSETSKIVLLIFEKVQLLWNALQGVFGVTKDLLGELVLFGLESLAGGIEALATAINITTIAIKPVIPLLENIVAIATPLSGIFLKTYLTIKSLSLAVGLAGGLFGSFAKILPGVGEALYLINLRSNPLVNTFTNLQTVLGRGIGGFVSIAVAAGKFPPILNAVQSSLSKIAGGAFAQFAPMIAQLVPQLGKAGQLFAGFLTLVPALGTGFTKLITLNPNATINKILTGFASNLTTLGATMPALAGLTSSWATQLTTLGTALEASGNAATIASRSNALFASAIVQIKESIISTAFSLTKSIVLFYAFSTVIEKLILNNKDFLNGIREVTSAIRLFLDGVVASVQQFWLLYAAALAAWGVFKLYQSGVLATIATQIALGTTARNVSLMVTFLSNSLLLASDRMFVLAGALGTAGFTNFAASLSLTAEGLKMMGIALIKQTGFVVALRTAMQGLLATFVALLPLLLVVAAGVAAIAINYRIASNEFEKGNQILIEQNRRNDKAVKETIDNIEKNRKTQEFRVKNGIKLTDEEYKQNKRLHGELQSGIWLREEQIKTIDERLKREHLNPKAREQMEEEKKRLEALNEEQEKYLENIEIAPKPLEQLGTIYDQLALKAVTAEKAIVDSSGNADIFKQQASALIEVTKQQVALGTVTQSEARRRLELVARNNALEYGIRLEAINALKELEKSGSEQTIAVRAGEIDRLRTLSETGKLDRLEALKAIAGLETRTADERIESIRRTIAEQERLLGAEAEGNQGVIALKTELKKLEADRIKVGVEGQRAIAEEEQKRLESSFNKTKLAQERLQTLIKQGEIDRVTGAKREGQLALESIDNQIKATKKLIADRRLIYGEGIIDTPEFRELQLKLSTLEEQRAQARISTAESVATAEQKVLELRFNQTKVAQDRLQALVRQGRIDSLDATREESRLAVEAIDNQVRATEQLIASRRRIYGDNASNIPEFQELQYKLQTLQAQRDIAIVTNQVKIEQAIINKELQRTKNSIDAQVNSLNAQISSYKLIEDSLNRQKTLTNAQTEARNAQRSLIETELSAIAAGESSDRRRQKLAQITAAIKLQALLAEQEVQRQNLKLEEQQFELSLRRRDAELAQQTAGARATLAESQAKLQEALADPEKRRSSGLLIALQNEIEARRQQVDELVKQRGAFREGIPTEREGFRLRRQAQEAGQRQALTGAVSDLIGSIASPSLRRQLQRQFADILAGDRFRTTRRGLVDSGTATALAGLNSPGVQAIAPGLGRRARTPTTLTDFDPGLEDLQGQPGYDRALADAQKNYRKRFGDSPPNIRLTSGTPLNVPQLLSPQTFAPLTGGFTSFERSVGVFSKSIDRIKGGNITVNLNGNSKTINTRSQPTIEDVIRQLESL